LVNCFYNSTHLQRVDQMTRKIFLRIIFLILIGLGISIWLNRPPYFATNFPMHGLAIRSVYQASSNYDLTDICSPLGEPGGYLLVSGSINMRSIIGERQVFFQTNTTSNQVFLEYDPGQNSILQFGVADQSGTPQFVQLGRIKKVGLLNFVFLMRQDGLIQVFGNGTVDLPKQLIMGSIGSHQTINTAINCSNFRLNGGNGSMGTDGEVQVRVSSGATYEDGLKLFNQYELDFQNELPGTSFKWPLYAGILLLVVDTPYMILKMVKRFRSRAK
jgi:hypothetical protein